MKFPPRRLPTGKGWNMLRYRIGYILFLAAAVILYLFDSEYLAFYLLAAVIVLPFVSWLLTVLAVRKTSVRFELKTPCASRGEEVLLHVILKNRSFFPIAQAELRIRFENTLFGGQRTERLFLPVSGGPEQSADFRIKSAHCGKISVSLANAVYYDYFGIFTISPKITQSADLFVAPVPLFLDAAVGTSLIPGTESSTYSKFKPGDDPSEIFDIRPYREGDPMRSVHWKLTSRLNELMVKEFSLPADSSVLLLTELMADTMDALDTVLEALTSLSRFLLENEIRHSVEWYDAEHALYRETEIESDEGLAVLLNAMLSARRYTEEAYAAQTRDRMGNTARPFPHLIYLTGKLAPELASFFENRTENEKTTVLLCGGDENSRPEPASALEAAHAEVICVPSGRIQESLSGLMI